MSDWQGTSKIKNIHTSFDSFDSVGNYEKEERWHEKIVEDQEKYEAKKRKPDGVLSHGDENVKLEDLGLKSTLIDEKCNCNDYVNIEPFNFDKLKNLNDIFFHICETNENYRIYPMEAIVEAIEKDWADYIDLNVLQHVKAKIHNNPCKNIDLDKLDNTLIVKSDDSTAKSNRVVLNLSKKQLVNLIANFNIEAPISKKVNYSKITKYGCIVGNSWMWNYNMDDIEYSELQEILNELVDLNLI